MINCHCVEYIGKKFPGIRRYWQYLRTYIHDDGYIRWPNGTAWGWIIGRLHNHDRTIELEDYPELYREANCNQCKHRLTCMLDRTVDKTFESAR